MPDNRLLTNPTHDLLTQLILDCSSINVRVAPSHPGHTTIASQCSTMVYAIHMDSTNEEHGSSGIILYSMTVKYIFKNTCTV